MIIDFRDRQTVERAEQSQVLIDMLKQAIDDGKDIILLAADDSDIEIVSTIDFNSTKEMYQAVGMLDVAKMRLSGG